ncbi:MAG: NPCBM/NEW2 domain-containing protein [Verrucomicrobia bacterium]|nr:NPCBM/NEW2 domain-containing protein [Verrucomicrobiota bacterium]
MRQRSLHTWIITALAAGPWLATTVLCLGTPTAPVESPPPASTWLDDLPHGFIANPYGPPQSRLSFGKTPLRIAGRSFDRGLGTHAPSRLELNLDRRASRFTAFVGVDQGASYRTNLATWDRKQGAPPYVYDGNDDVFDKAQGATVRFRVLADGRELFDSGSLTESSEAREVSLPLTGVKRLVLLADSGRDGSFADHADWADARLELAAGATGEGLVLSAPVEGIIVNHVGFTPASAKLFLVDADQPRDFAVISARTGQPVFNGRTMPRAGDWGVMFEGDFSELREPGTYSIRCAHQTSAPFNIRPDLDQHLLAKHLNWFLMQRCGDPRNGWERGQHADDGRRRDNGRHQDVSGGWHDAADLRKWCMTVTGLWALTEWATTLEGPPRPRVLDEIRWGNKYFLAMQEPDGFLMSHIGGDVERHGDNNRFTDNQPGTADDRVIATDPAAPEIQWVFILSQVNAARAFATEDAAYAQRCRQAAERAYAWMTPRLNPHDAYAVGGALAAASRLFALTSEPRLRDDARRFLAQLRALQETNTSLPYGFFYTGEPSVPAHERSAGAPGASQRRIPAHNLYMGNLPLWGLCAYAESFPAPDREAALDALRRYVDGYCLPFDQRSTFGIVPYALYRDDPGGARRFGAFFYRWAYVNREDNAWWNGINPHIASTGAALAKAGRLLNRPEPGRIAQRQLDFIYGANPFDASTAEGLGHNQPDFFKTTEHVPHTPWISGAIMAGIGSSNGDQPVLLPGWWQTTEYWMEAVAHTLLLIRELSDFD